MLKFKLNRKDSNFYLVLTIVILVVFYLFYLFVSIMIKGQKGQKENKKKIPKLPVYDEEEIKTGSKYLLKRDHVNQMLPLPPFKAITSDMRIDPHFSLDLPLKRERSKGNRLVPFGYQNYECPRRDSHFFLDRDLKTGLGSGEPIHMDYSSPKKVEDPLVKIEEHLTMSEDELRQRFPDYDKKSYGLSSTQNPADILKPVPYKDKGLSIQIPDSLKSIDTRPYEQKRLDDLLDTENVYIYLIKQRLLEDMTNGTKIANDQKLAFYYNLFIGGLDDLKDGYQFYVSKIGTPGYVLDPKLTDKIQRYYLGNPNLFTQISRLYDEILKRESTRGSVGLNAADVTEFKGKLGALKVDMPQYLMADGEDEIKEDSFDVIRSFADDVNEFFNTLNNSIAPYYVYMFDLAIPGVLIPAEDQGAELSRSFVSDMASLQTLYSDITLAYIYKSDIFSKILNNPKNTMTGTATNKLAKYRQNILLLPNISAENAKLINQLFDEGKITEVQCEAFETTVNQIITLNKYFSTLYNLYLINPEKPDYAALKGILTGASPFNLSPQQNGTIIKSADKPPSDMSESIQYGFQNITTSVKYPLVTPIYGFSSAAVEVKPLDKNSIKAAASSGSSSPVPSAAQMGNAISSGATQAANTIAQGSSQAAKEVAKGATQVGNAIASGATQAANKVGSAVKKAFKKPKWL